MKQVIKITGLAAVLAVSLIAAAAPSPVKAYGEANAAYAMGDKPLVIIRFNQRVVTYERPLYIAVSRALQTKPTAMFDLVSLIPGGNGTMAQKAESDLNRVVSTMLEMGVPRDRLSVTRQPGGALESNEVHIYVR